MRAEWRDANLLVDFNLDVSGCALVLVFVPAFAFASARVPDFGPVSAAAPALFSEFVLRSAGGSCCFRRSACLWFGCGGLCCVVGGCTMGLRADRLALVLAGGCPEST